MLEACSEEHPEYYFCHSNIIDHRINVLAIRLLHLFLLLSFALWHGKKKGRQSIKHSCYRKDFFKTLSIESQYRKISQCTLIPLKLSPWQKLLGLQNDQAFIMMGFDNNFFDRILLKFGPMYSGHMPFDNYGKIVEFKYTRGQKREVQLEDCLRLVLVWTQTKGSLNVLQLVFGLTYTNLSVYLRFGMCHFVNTFRDNLLT